MIPDSLFAAIAAALKLADKIVPSDELRLELFKARHPVRFERIQRKATEQKLRKLRRLYQFAQKHGLKPEQLAQYAGGDIHTADLLNQMLNHKP